MSYELSPMSHDLRAILPQKDELSAIAIPGGDCAVGSYCAVASFNETHPTDAVVIATWT